MNDAKAAYEQKLKAKMDEWNAEIDKLTAKASQAEADAKIEYDKELQKLRSRRDELKQKMEALRQAGEGAWEDVKSGLESAWKELDEDLRSAAARFK